jgi:DNA helicase-2/ATP-dependent DNA helicase PcrA
LANKNYTIRAGSSTLQMRYHRRVEDERKTLRFPARARDDSADADAGAHSDDNFAEELNSQQRAAVCAEEPQVLVLAGAGSGKTRVITYRVAWLLRRGVKPANILLATFTNKAARMMLSRVEALTKVPPGRIMGGTFHHIAHIILRKHAELLGYTRDFTIIDEQDAKQLMKVVRKEAPVDFTEKLFPSPQVLYRIHSLSVNTAQPVEEVLVRSFPQFIRYADEVRGVLISYTERKLARNLMDFDDLLTNLHRLFVEQPDAARAVSARYEHVLVDEYQDTNIVQMWIVKRLSEVHGRVFVVGDDAQSIYSFRGATRTYCNSSAITPTRRYTSWRPTTAARRRCSRWPTRLCATRPSNTARCSRR